MSDGIKRRDFLKVLGATGTGATLFGCSTQQVEKLIPYMVPDEHIVPGVATWYATVCGECPAGCGMWVRTREGRAVKVEGNPRHPVSGGALCARGQASLQGLYDPDRVPGPLVRENGALRRASWDEAEALLAQRLAAARGAIYFITGSTGPAFGELVDAWLGAAGGVRVPYEPLSEAPLREAARIAFGREVVPSYRFEAARHIVSFGADFLETWLSPVAYARGFARARAVSRDGRKGRFVFVGPRLSLTGQNADEWVPVRPGTEGPLALGMAHVIVERGGHAGPYAPVIERYRPAEVAEVTGVPAEVIEELAVRFLEERPSLAVGPGVAGQHRHATAANLAVLVLNWVAGNVGTTVDVQRPDLAAAADGYGDLEAAIREMANGTVGAVLVYGANPAYSLPPAAGFREAFARVPLKVSFSTFMDETAALADLVLPEPHFLESWGDSHPLPGVYALRQPVMQAVPHFDSKHTGDVLLSVALRLGRPLGHATFYGYLRASWERVFQLAGRPPATFDEFWRTALRDGVVELAASVGGAPELRLMDTAVAFDAPEFDGEEGMDLHLLVYPSARLYDGRMANRPWLHELPDPVSKIAWHSWVEVNPATARRLGIRDGDIVRVRSPHGSLEVPVWTYPGVREDTVAIPLGGGHEALGRHAQGRGVNPAVLLPSLVEQPSGGQVWFGTRVALEPTGRRRVLAEVQGSDEQHDRALALAVSLAALARGAATGAPEEHAPVGAPGRAAGPAPGVETQTPHGAGAGEARRLHELQAGGGFVPVPTDGRPEAFPLEGSRYGPYDPAVQPRWAMVIDLDRCTGCAACVTACYAENNVGVVGENQVIKGRELAWIRIERYYETVDASGPGPLDVRHLPMLCQQCGNAPCEPVCPVYATYHTPDGLNAQVYNRCVGTRYCANNCPYKVRVFNWFTFSAVPEPLNWQYNPDVTVREGGVMEKCTFCVQRIRDAENRAKLEGRNVYDGEIVPACQQTCPAQAIVFGNIRDPGSRVARLAADRRRYRVLETLNTQPAVTYLKKVTFHDVEEAEHA